MDRLFSFASSMNGVIKIFRNSLMPHVARLFQYQKVRRYLFGFISQLNIHYHENQFILENITSFNRNRLLRAGYRAPDAHLGEKGSVFGLIQDYGFHVLVMSSQLISDSEKQKFREEWKQVNLLFSAHAQIHWLDDETDKEALEAYQVENQLVCLIRPDGYIAYMKDYL